MASGNLERPGTRGECLRAAGASLLVVLLGVLLLPLEPSFFWHDDYQSYQLACFLEVGRAWRVGEWPLLNPHSWQCGALAAEYQNGTFSVFLSGLAVLISALPMPLPYAAAVFSLTHLAVLAAGAYALARQRGLSADLALFVALVASLNGAVFVWGGAIWFPGLAAFAWLPWFWWALRSALAGPGGRRFVPAGLFLYLLLAAGWPYAVLMAGLVTLRLLAERPAWSAVGRIAAAWAVGLGLSAPAWMMLVEFAGHTVRGRENTPNLLQYNAIVRADALPALLFPPQMSPVTFFFGSQNDYRVCVELAGGLVPLAVLLAVRRSAWVRDLRGEAAFALLTLALAMGPGLGSFRWSFRWLPLFFLSLALLAAEALARARRAPGGAPRLAPFALALTAAGAVYSVRYPPAPEGVALRYGLLAGGGCLLWAGLERRASPAARWRAWAPAAAVWLSSVAFLTRYSPPLLELPTWDARPFAAPAAGMEPGRRYLCAYSLPDMIEEDRRTPIVRMRGGGSDLFVGNTGTYAGVTTINGYSPLRPLNLTELFGFGVHGGLDDPETVHRLLTADAGPAGLLAALGIDGLIVAERYRAGADGLEARGWRQVGPTTDGRGQIYHRLGPAGPAVFAVARAEWTGDRLAALGRLTGPVPGARAVLLSPDGPPHFQALPPINAEVNGVTTSRNAATADVRNPSAEREAVVALARPWFPGYRATLDGQPLPVELYDLVLPAVRLPPAAAGRLVFEYRPASFVGGIRLEALTFAVLLVSCPWSVVRCSKAKSKDN